jgi:hypothetical protein
MAAGFGVVGLVAVVAGTTGEAVGWQPVNSREKNRSDPSILFIVAPKSYVV